jgi:hypothetical protein
MDIEQEIQNLKTRNVKVEQDKAWEISKTRKFFICSVTYSIAAGWLLTIHETLPWLKAFVPVFGYYLSTLSLPFIKRWWLKNN